MGRVPVTDIRKDFHVARCDWEVSAFCGSLHRMRDDIVRELEMIDCPEHIIREADSLLRKGIENNGLTYTNRTLRHTVLVIGTASSAAEFFNSLTHESRHLEAHIADTFSLDPFGEEICYIAGEIAANLFPLAQPYLCYNSSSELT